jgi:cyclopropane fatty-acyl-phospholipid synthase-like methyltransferase
MTPNPGKPFSAASERNRIPIINLLRPLFAGVESVLEIGSGTGQHAVFFGAQIPHLTWQTSDLAENHPAIRMWVEEVALSNVLPPLVLDVDAGEWPVERVDAVFTANTLHIVSWSSVENMFAGVARVLNDHGLFCAYGPFSYDGRHTSESNAGFDLALRGRNSHSGIRDFAQVCELAAGNDLSLQDDHAMPANNRLLVYRKDG